LIPTFYAKFKRNDNIIVYGYFHKNLPSLQGLFKVSPGSESGTSFKSSRKIIRRATG
jgi:hypothetical protein